MSSAPPISAPAGTRTSVKLTSAVQAPSWPIFLSLAPTSTPGVSAATRKTAMPAPSASAGLVRANATNRSAVGALVMKRFWPLITQSAAVTDCLGPQARRVGAGAGLGQRERRDDVAGGDPLQPRRLLLVGAEPDEHLTGDAVVGAEHRPQRQRRVAELHRQLDILGDVETESAPLLRDRITEQAHLPGLLAQVVGDPVVGENLLFARNDGGADEVAGLGQDLLEILIADFGSGHRESPRGICF